MKTRQELTEILDFIADYATYLLASGVHTSRVIRNSQRIGQSQGVDIQLSSFQKSTILTVRDDATGEAITRVVKIPALPISFERNSDLSALSWDALDDRLPLGEIRRRYGELIDKPRIDPIFVLVTVGLANASFCRLFGGDWTAAGIVFTATLEFLKLGSDHSVFSGITHSVFHGFNYSPPEAPFPGWIRYGAYYNENNTWWPYLRHFMDYKGRLSAVLQQADMYTDIGVLPPLSDMWSTMGFISTRAARPARPMRAGSRTASIMLRRLRKPCV